MFRATSDVGYVAAHRWTPCHDSLSFFLSPLSPFLADFVRIDYPVIEMADIHWDCISMVQLLLGEADTTDSYSGWHTYICEYSPWRKL